MKRAHGAAFPLLAVRKADRVRPRLAAELPVAIEELSELTYPNFANSQYVAAQDKVSKIAERRTRSRAGQNLLWTACSAQLTC
jgi:hypothetical protein